MKRRLNERIEIGDEVYSPRDEYYVTVLDIKGDRVLADGPMGKEYHNLSDLEKKKDYESEDLYEGRKKIIRLTERDLSRIVKQVINEEPIDDYTSQGIYRKLVQAGEEMDQGYQKIKKLREELDYYVNQHLRRGSISDIFDYTKRTPNDVSDIIQQLNRKISQLEENFANYKRLVRNSISN